MAFRGLASGKLLARSGLYSSSIHKVTTSGRPAMRSVSLGTAVLVLLGADLSIAVDKTLLKGFSQSVSGDGFLAMPVGTVNRPPGARRAANAFEDQLNNMDFFYATDGKSPGQLVD